MIDFIEMVGDTAEFIAINENRFISLEAFIDSLSNDTVSRKTEFIKINI